MAAVVAMPTVLTSCKEELAKETKFDVLYGYWINSDHSCALEIGDDGGEYANGFYFKIDSYVHTPEGLRQWNNAILKDDELSLIYDSFRFNMSPKYEVYVSVQSYGQNHMYLKKTSGEGELSSYSFSRVTEAEFYDFIEGNNSGNSGNSGNNNQDQDDAQKLIGSWVGYDGTPGIGPKFILTFYSDGRATERVNDSFTNVGTYKYSNGKITEFIEGEGSSVLANCIGRCPWTVLFNSSTSMTFVTSNYYEITFTKQ